MRWLPDKNFKANYKKRYIENYEKITARREEKDERRAKLNPILSTNIKQVVLGSVSVIAIFACILGTGVYISSEYGKKEDAISQLKQDIAYSEEIVREYQVINSDEKFEQIDDALVSITNLQNMYLTGIDPTETAAYVNQYLGDYTEAWLTDINCENPEWKGYIDWSYDLRDEVRMVFVLCDNISSVGVVRLTLQIDKNGNLSGVRTFDEDRLL